MGNLCCAERKKKDPEGDTKEDIERTIKDAEEDQVINELRENFNIDTFNALFEKNKRKHPERMPYGLNHCRGGGRGLSLIGCWML